jgi:hypothetical protein
LENKNVKKDDFLTQKRRRKQFENESNFGEWKEVKVEKKKIILNEKEYCKKDNNHFCLYCDFFKIFDF